MYNSTIKKKYCKCGCNKPPTTQYAGYNYSCAPEEVKAGVKEKTRKQLKEARQRLQRKILNLKVVEDTEQELWFLAAAQELAKNPHCQECGTFIPERFYRAATAHILPKRNEYGLPSVATHPANRLFLGGGCGCHNKTHRWDQFSKMKVWPLAVTAFKEIYPCIAEEEKKNIPQVLLDTLFQMESVINPIGADNQKQDD